MLWRWYLTLCQIYLGAYIFLEGIELIIQMVCETILIFIVL